MDIAKLAIEVDASQATAAAKQLDALSKSAETASTASAGVEKTSVEVEKAINKSSYRLKEAASALDLTSTSSGYLNSEFVKIKQASNPAVASFVSIANSVNRLDEELVDGKISLSEYYSSIAAITSSTDNAAAGFARSGKEAGNSAYKYRMAAMQLSQVASQGSVTGNYLQALAIQLPDLALGLGTVGIVAGALAGALAGPMINALSGASKSIDDLADELDALDGSFDVAADGSYKLSEELVRLARISEQAAKLKVAVETEQARKSILSLGIAIAEQSDALIGSTKLSVAEQNKLRDAISATVQSTDPAAYENLANVVSELDSKYREATAAARENLTAAREAAKQSGLSSNEQYKLRMAVKVANQEYLSLNGTMGSATTELAKYTEAGLRAADIYKRLTDGGADWEKLLTRTNESMSAGMDFWPSSADYYDEQLRLLRENNAEQLRVDAALVQSRADSLKTIEALEAAQMTQQEKLTDNYLTQQSQISAALGAGVIDVEEANALKLASDKQYADQKRQLDMMAASAALSTASNMFGNLAAIAQAGGEDQFQTYKRLAQAQAGISAALGALAVIGDPTIPAPLKPFAVGAIGALAAVQIAQIEAQQYTPARALGGQVQAGTSYLVGERGPELVTMGANGYVTPNDKLQGNNQTVVLQISTGVSQTVRAEMAAMMPGIVKMIGQATGGRR